jgi:hypothetical protein
MGFVIVVRDLWYLTASVVGCCVYRNDGFQWRTKLNMPYLIWFVTTHLPWLFRPKTAGLWPDTAQDLLGLAVTISANTRRQCSCS